jgi:hypothetical protein
MKQKFPLLIILLMFITLNQWTFAQTTTVTQEFITDPEWTGNGNSGNIAPPVNDYGYRNLEGITGVYPGNPGCIGGVFCRSTTYSYYADTELGGTIDRTMSFRLAGSFYLENRSSGGFDGNFYLGYFDATNPDKNNYIGIGFVEPSGSAEAAFRGYAGVSGPGGKGTDVIPLSQLIPLTFDLTWTGSSNGSGTFTGTLAGQDVNLSVEAGNSTFNAFGLFCGGSSTSANLRTRNCYFDNLLYTKISASSVNDKSESKVRIYPNVTSDRIYFSNIPENSRIELVDMLGKKVFQKNALDLSSGLSLKSCTNGVYMIMVIQGNEIIESVKIMKQ